MMAALTALRDRLATVPGVATCKVGMEANMTPADYPMVRIVPSTLAIGKLLSSRRCELTIYFGQPIHEFSAGLESLYSSLFTMEAALINAANTTPGLLVEYLETVLDEDRLDAYKLMAVRLAVEQLS